VGVIANAAKAMEATSSGVGVIANASKAIEALSSGVGVKANAAKAMEATSSGVGVIANASKAIEALSSGVGVIANAAKAIEATATGVGVIANVGRAVIVDNAGVGINYDSTLQVTSNRLGVSNSAFSRIKTTVQVNTMVAVYKTIMWAHMDNPTYGRIAVIINNRQQFVLTLTGYIAYPSGTGAAVLDISNCIKPSGSPIGKVRLADTSSTGYGFMVSLEVLSNATIAINYSLCDLMGVVVGSEVGESAWGSVTHDLNSPGQITLNL
jgi:hypothetical protein